MSKRKNKKTVIVIPPSGDYRLHEVEDPTLEQLQEWVGGYIEVIPARKKAIAEVVEPLIGKKVLTTPVMYGNEDGMALGLQYNPTATTICLRGRVLCGGGFVGNAVIVCALRE